MRISKAGNTSVSPLRQTSEHTVRPMNHFGWASDENYSPPLPGPFSSSFADMDMPLPEEELRSLVEAFRAVDLNAGEVNDRAALRALLLLRNGVPLSSGLLQQPKAGETIPLFQEASGLLNRALELLGNLERDAEPAGLVRKLTENLAYFYGDEFKTLTHHLGEAGGMRRALHQSGLMFEWRLLAWFNAGRNPRALEDFLRCDLKGALLAFLCGLENVRRPKGARRKIRVLEDAARALLNRITARQLDIILDNANGRRNIYFEVPYGNSDGRAYAGIQAYGENREPDESVDPAFFTISLEIKTTKLGFVRVKLLFFEKTIIAAFTLRTRKILSLAKCMEDEFREMLRYRGFEPGIIRFILPGEAEAYTTGRKPRKNRIDRRA